MSDGRISAPARDALTPRQREVMHLIAAGKTNFEIAQHLGVSLEGAKYHVSEILGKLGVDSREEAVAAWQSGEQRWRWPRMRFLVPAAAGIAAVAGIAVTAVLLLALLQDDDPTPSGEPEAWLAWIADDGSRQLHIRRSSQPDVELFPDTDYVQLDGPQWSPDGRYLAAVGFTGPGGWEIVLFDRETRRIRSAPVDSLLGPPAWKPDSSAVTALTETTVLTFDTSLHEIGRSAPPADDSLVAAMPSLSVWSPDGQHLLLLAYGNLLVMSESGEFSVVPVPAEATGPHAAADSEVIYIANFDPEPFRWNDKDSFRITAFPPRSQVSAEDAVAWTGRRTGDSWLLGSPEPAVLPAELVAPGETESHGFLLATLEGGTVQAQSSIDFEGARNNPDQGPPASLVRVFSTDRVYGEFRLENILLVGPAASTRQFDIVLVSD
ncbi:MAG: helix-turn-helix transcriptional regulator [Dehalococcoidia bacterium]